MVVPIMRQTRVFDQEPRENEAFRGKSGGWHAGPWSKCGGDMEKRAGGWARWVSRLGRGEKEGEPEVDQRRSIVLHEERSLSMLRTTRHIAANEGMRNKERTAKKRRLNVLRVRSCP
jgi:hypothetical protein